MVLNKDVTFSEWKMLSSTEKLYIINNHWNPYEPLIGITTKREIIDNFIKTIPINGLQYGIRSFGWEVYFLFIIVENSKTRIPEKFSDIPINKGVVKKWIDDKHVEVKFRYGGTEVISLEERIIIK